MNGATTAQLGIRGRRSPFLLDAVVLSLVKIAVGAWVIASGFSHVSDDDFARTVIAQAFAHAPRLDPSATSWLPLPFWIGGAAMAIAGRTLETARVTAVVLGAAAVGACYAAMREGKIARRAAVLSTTVAMCLPWNAWLGVATVPEGWADALVAAAAIAMTSARARPFASAALLTASLSRYEAWPACLVFAILCVTRATQARAEVGSAAAFRRDLICAAVALSGPLLWIAWNAHAHGSALHFIVRVSSFRRATGGAAIPLRDKILGYPWTLLSQTPDVAALGLVGAVGCLLDAPLRTRWSWAGATAGAIMAFLIVGDVRDSAPTHHPERALVAVSWVLVAMGIDAIGVVIAGAHDVGRRWAAGTAVLLGVAWCASLPSRYAKDAPGNGESDRREAQIARGLQMRTRPIASVEITPCAFEHFALLAAWGKPELARIQPSLHRPPTPDCPLATEERAALK